MSDNDKYGELLQHILESDAFKEKDIYQRLLTYLVDATLNGITPREITIAQDVFNKGADFDGSADTTVRVYVHNLRNKLDQYYQLEGRNDPLKIQIPKGHYRVEFINKKFSNLSIQFHNKLVSVLSVLVILLITYIFVDKILTKKDIFNQLTNTGNIIWKDFFNNNYPSSLVIGDFFVFHEYNTQLGRARRIQDYQINTQAELDVFKQSFPQTEIDNWQLGELPHNSIFNLVDLFSVFHAYQKKFEIDFTTEIDINFIKNRNIIFVGEFKNLRVLSNLLSNIPIHFETLPWWQGSLSYQENDSLIELKTSHNWEVSRYVVDLGIVAKLPGLNRENYLLVCGFGYDAQVKIVEMLSHDVSLAYIEKQVKERFQEIPDYFVMVFEIRGFDRASSTGEIKYFYPLSTDNPL